MGKRTRKTLAISEALHILLGTPEALRELAIAKLWRHWSDVVGNDVALLVHPLGHRKTTMLLGADNSIVMQEFSYFAPQLLEKANTFLGASIFQKVQIELMAGRRALDAPLARPKAIRPTSPTPEPLGNLLPCMDESSPVTACYRAYVQHFFPDLEIPKQP